MWNMIWPVLVVIGANTLYNICAKQTPEGINSFASLAITYAVAAVFSVIMFFVTGDNKNLFAELSKANWTSVVLGIAVVGLEFGFLSVYRAGWKISTAQLVSSIGLSAVLVFVGILAYKEVITPKQIVGLIISGVGLALIAK